MRNGHGESDDDREQVTSGSSCPMSALYTAELAAVQAGGVEADRNFVGRGRGAGHAISSGGVVDGAADVALV